MHRRSTGPVAEQIVRAVETSGTTGADHLNPMREHTWVREGLARVNGRLVSGGWLLSERDSRRIRMCGVPLLGLSVIGFVGVAFAAARDTPTAGRLAASVGALVASFLLGRVPDQRPAVEAELDKLRLANAHLDPEAEPALVTYGPAAAALAVALFGTTVLMPLDPRFALAADLLVAGDPQAAAAAERKAAEKAESSGGGCGGCGGCGCGG
jgi:uncharacterized protein (TIGR04222 family)